MAFTPQQLRETGAIATQLINSDIANQLTKINYFYYCMTTKSLKFRSGGTQIQQAIYFEENKSQGFINGTFDVLPTNVNQQITFAVYDWKYYNSNVNITLVDFTETDETAAAIEDMLSAKRRGAISSYTRQLSEAMFGSGADNGGKAFNGLTDIFAASGVSYAGLNNNDFPDPTTWLTEIDTIATTPNYTNITKMLSLLNTRGSQYGGGSVSTYKPNLMVSNDAVYTKFMSTLQAQQRFTGKEILKAGFTGQDINGVFWQIDANSQGSADGIKEDNFLYLISTESINMYYKYGFGKRSPYDQNIQIPNQPIKSDQMFLAGNLGCNTRRVNGVFKNFIA